MLVRDHKKWTQVYTGYNHDSIFVFWLPYFNWLPSFLLSVGPSYSLFIYRLRSITLNLFLGSSLPLYIMIRSRLSLLISSLPLYNDSSDVEFCSLVSKSSWIIPPPFLMILVWLAELTFSICVGFFWCRGLINLGLFVFSFFFFLNDVFLFYNFDNIIIIFFKCGFVLVVFAVSLPLF